MLLDAKLHKQFWAEAAVTAAYLCNRTPCRDMKDTTPEEIWSKQKPNLSSLRVFGCKAMVHIPKEKRKKLDSKSNECIFVGYSDQTKGYRLYNPKSRAVIVSRDVKFFEHDSNQVIAEPEFTNSSVYSPKNSIGVGGSDTDDDVTESESSDDDEDEISSHKLSEGTSTSEGGSTSEDSDVREISRVTTLDESQCHDDLNSTPHTDASTSPVNETNSSVLAEPAENASNVNEPPIVETEPHAESSEGLNSTENSVYDSFHDVDYEVAASEYACICVSDGDSSGPIHVGLTTAMSIVNEPTTVQQALRSADREKWYLAMINEYNALIENGTWELADLPRSNRLHHVCSTNKSSRHRIRCECTEPI